MAIRQIQKFPAFEFERLDITHFDALKELFQQHKFDAVMNLAARAGVRASVENPWIYFETNIIGTLNLLELCSLRSPTTSSYGFERWLRSVYGDDPEFIQEQNRWYQKILLTFANIYDLDAEVMIARAPARINLVGMVVYEVNY